MIARTKMDFRLLTAGTVLLVGAFGASCGGVKPRGAAKITPKTDDQTAEQQQNSSEINQLEVSREAFRLTLHPVVRANCAGCHSGATAPSFAVEDAITAHDAVVDNHKVDFADVNHSRLVMRLSRDAHNCWTSDCSKDAEKMETAINEWAQKIKDAGGSVGESKFEMLTSELAFTDSADAPATDTGLPGTYSFFVGERVTTAAPWSMMTDDPDTAVDGAADYMIPTGAIPAASDQVTFTFEVAEAGNYDVFFRAKSAANNSNGIRYRINGQPAGFRQTSLRIDKPDQYVWSRGNNRGNNAYRDTAGDFVSLPLQAGSNTLQIAALEANVRVSAVAVSNQTVFSVADMDSNFSSGLFPRRTRVLVFPLKELTGKNARLIVEVRDFDAEGHAILLRNLRIETDAPIRIKDVMPLINGKFNPMHATFRLVDTTVQAPGAILSKASLIAIGQKGFAEDKLSFTFGELE